VSFFTIRLVAFLSIFVFSDSFAVEPKIFVNPDDTKYMQKTYPKNLDECLQSREADPLKENFKALSNECHKILSNNKRRDDCLLKEKSKPNYLYHNAWVSCDQQLVAEDKANEGLTDYEIELKEIAISTGENTMLLYEVCRRKTREKIVQSGKHSSLPSNPYIDLIKEDEENVKRTIKECKSFIKEEFDYNISHENTDVLPVISEKPNQAPYQFEQFIKNIPDRSIQTLVKTLTELVGVFIFLAIYKVVKKK